MLYIHANKVVVVIIVAIDIVIIIGSSSAAVEEEEMEEMERSQLSSVQTLGSDAQASAADEQGSGTDMEVGFFFNQMCDKLFY